MATHRNTYKTIHVKLLKALISYKWRSNFNQNPLFYIIREGHYIYFKLLLSGNFCQFDESPGKCTSKTRQVETKPVCT